MERPFTRSGEALARGEALFEIGDQVIRRFQAHGDAQQGRRRPHILGPSKMSPASPVGEGPGVMCLCLLPPQQHDLAAFAGVHLREGFVEAVDRVAVRHGIRPAAVSRPYLPRRRCGLG